MSIRSGFLSVFALASVLALPVPAAAQDTPDPDAVLATVNGTDITLGHMIALRAGLPEQYAQLPAELLFDGILDQLIQQTLLMQDHNGDLSRRNALVLENERRGIIAGEVIDEVMTADLSDEAVQAVYDEDYAGAEAETEYQAAHILVETEDDANSIVQDLTDGADFAELAAEKSTGPSGPNGGDLGWFGAGVMVEPFFQAVAALEPGQVSDPVETQFGWHVIKLNETRVKDAPKLDEVRADIEEQLRQAAFDAHLEKLTEGAKINRADTSEIDPETVNNLDLLEN
ncbi:peptidylprolyl isomerase [Roseovarius gahaiensis]|uniref:Parvulin-like PPIase n=1 Tax=Roseovarius gahaiensis TaxID=2716691 RepID=A0A967EJS7_9RHOB|nr:peptidylprolyl isomerase [Roseovarius gahaiensis]NHQ73114.1 peptidylprolyl isomerase [Roseovarius gahaiensis]